MVENKRILKLIAKRWAKGILLATFMDSEEADEILSPEEQDFVVGEVHKIAERITGEDQNNNLDEIIQEYFDFK